MPDLSILVDIMISHWGIILLFFLIATLYSSVGFGGGSSYLAVLALTSLSFTHFRAIALLCNIVVVGGNIYIFSKKGIINWRKVTPLVLLSIPMAFIGGFLRISQTFFFIILGVTLIAAAGLMWTSKYISKKSYELSLRRSRSQNIGYGGGIGFISGMVGIGGGIFLAPLLHLTRWDTPRKIAAASSFFILVNSIAGLIGQYFNPDFSIEPNIAIILICTVFLGGQLGSRISAHFIDHNSLKKITALLILFVGFRILWKHLL